MYRSFGGKAAIPVAILDLGKGILSVLLGLAYAPHFMNSWDFALLTGILCVLGHSFTCFAGFRGGKGVLTAFGVYLCLVPFAALGAFAIWLGVVWTSRYVSLASMLAAIVLFILVLWEYTNGLTTVLGVLITAILSSFVVYRHKGNIHRLLNGTEHRFGNTRSRHTSEGEIQK
jgi:glycerol-3-phosphate acyltransferase PlsY